jgi:hypothetical protein
LQAPELAGKLPEIAAERRDPAFAEKVLRDHHVRACVTSIENRDRVPLVPPVRPGDVDLGAFTHPEAWNMFDFNGLLWPELVDDRYSTLHGDLDGAAEVMEELLFRNPARVHSIPI